MVITMTTSNGNIFRVTGLCAGNSPVTGEFPAKRPVTRSFEVFVGLRPNKRLSKQSRSWWFETPSHPLWRHSNDHGVLITHSSKIVCIAFVIICISLDNDVVYHYGDVVMGTVASQITSLTIVYSTVYSGADQRKHQSSASLAFVRGIHRGPVNSPHKWQVTRKMFPFDDVIIV